MWEECSLRPGLGLLLAAASLLHFLAPSYFLESLTSHRPSLAPLSHTSKILSGGAAPLDSISYSLCLHICNICLHCPTLSCMGELKNETADFPLCSIFYGGESLVGSLPQLTFGMSCFRGGVLSYGGVLVLC